MAISLAIGLAACPAVAADEARRCGELPAPVAKFGGRLIVRAPAVTVLEGEHDGRRLIVNEVPSMEQLEALYRSPEYQTLIAIRSSAPTSDLWAVPGV